MLLFYKDYNNPIDLVRYFSSQELQRTDLYLEREPTAME